jgi:tetratricopeptide (TPR) repeat protein
VFWINGTSVATIQESYYQIGVACGIPGVDRSESECMLRINRWLESTKSGQWLIIVDNADDPAVLDQVTANGGFIFPPECPRGYILWTTRNSHLAEWVSSRADSIQVSGLSESEGATLLSEMIASEKSQKVLHDLGLLSSTLDHLPLAISQAASYMTRYNVSVGEYLKYFNSVHETQSVLKFEHTDSTRNRGWESLFKTWSLSFAQLSPYAIEVLTLMSFLQPDSIPTSLLSQQFVDKLQLDQALSELRKLSLVASDNEGKSYTIHRLVQGGIQIWLEDQDSSQTRVNFMSMSLRLLGRVFKPSEDDGWESSLELLPHAIRVLSFVPSSKEDLLARAHLLERISRCELRLGRLQSTQEFALEAFQIHATLHGDTDLQTLRCQAHLARVLSAMGSYGEAKIHAEQATSGLESIDVDGSDYLSSMDILAHVLQEIGHYDRARRISGTTLRQRTQKLGETHPSTLINRTNLASVLNSQGMLKETEETYRQSIDMMKEKLGTEHPNTLAANNDYASVLGSLERYDEAEAIHRENLAARVRTLGERHPDTLASMENLANVLGHQGRYTEAADLHQHTMEALSTMLGTEHPHVITSMVNLAVALAGEGRYPEATEICTEAVQLRERVLGADHPATRASKDILNGIHSRQKSKDRDGSEIALVVSNGSAYQINGATFSEL